MERVLGRGRWVSRLLHASFDALRVFWPLLLLVLWFGVSRLFSPVGSVVGFVCLLRFLPLVVAVSARSRSA